MVFLAPLEDREVAAARSGAHLVSGGVVEFQGADDLLVHVGHPPVGEGHDLPAHKSLGRIVHHDHFRAAGHSRSRSVKHVFTRQGTGAHRVVDAVGVLSPVTDAGGDANIPPTVGNAADRNVDLEEKGPLIGPGIHHRHHPDAEHRHLRRGRDRDVHRQFIVQAARTVGMDHRAAIVVDQQVRTAPRTVFEKHIAHRGIGAAQGELRHRLQRFAAGIKQGHVGRNHSLRGGVVGPADRHAVDRELCRCRHLEEDVEERIRGHEGSCGRTDRKMVHARRERGCRNTHQRAARALDGGGEGGRHDGRPVHDLQGHSARRGESIAQLHPHRNLHGQAGHGGVSWIGGQRDEVRRVHRQLPPLSRRGAGHTDFQQAAHRGR